MSLSVEELLKPRYKVIADYPGSRVSIEDILRWDDLTEGYWNGKGQYFLKGTVEGYPHLFQKLEWYEERSHEELPDYVKRVYNGKLFVYKKEYWENSQESKGIKYTTSDGISLLNYIGTCEIATLEEYNAYQSSIKDTTTLTNK